MCDFELDPFAAEAVIGHLMKLEQDLRSDGNNVSLILMAMF